MSNRRFSKPHLDRLLKPRSVAVVGATDRVGALGATLLNNLIRYQFSGDIYPVNPKRDELMGLRVYATVEELPRGIDCAVLAIPRPAVLATTRTLAERDCGAVVIYSAGFAETNEAGLREQEELTQIALEHSLVIAGPNCLGCTNYVERIPLTFVETNMVTPVQGQRAVGIVSQSGALAAVLATQLHARGCYVSRSISTGNEAASSVEDYLDWLIDDERTQVISVYLEAIRRPSAFLAAARRALQSAKPLIVLHAGKSGKARASAATHTGAIAGDPAVLRAKLAREGVIFAESMEEWSDITNIALTCSRLPGSGLAVLGESGALRGLAFDLADELGLDLLELGNDNSPALRAALPDFVAVTNPLDITAAGLTDPDIYTRTLSALLDDARVGTVLASIIQSDPATCKLKFPPIMKVLESGAVQKALVFAGVDEGADVPQDYIAGLRRVGIPWFPTTERAYRAIARLVERDQRELSANSEGPLEMNSLSGQRGTLSQSQAQELLQPTGIRISLGHPAKAEKTAGAPRREGAELAESAELAKSADLPEGAELAESAQMIVRAKSDPEWGPVLEVGFAGATELLNDVGVFTPDMGQDAVRAGLMQLKQAPVLLGYRGAPALDVEALVQLVVLVGRVALGNPSIRELDLTPVLVQRSGDGVSALGVRIVLAE